MTYRIEFTSAAERKVQKLDPPTRRRVQAAIELLAANPHPPAAKRIKGQRDRLRVRTGDYRIVYRIEDDRLVVIVITVGHRREVYR